MPFWWIGILLSKFLAALLSCIYAFIELLVVEQIKTCIFSSYSKRMYITKHTIFIRIPNFCRVSIFLNFPGFEHKTTPKLHLSVKGITCSGNERNTFNSS